MKIVIDISEEDYKMILKYHEVYTSYPITTRLYKAVKNSTPLPKGNGTPLTPDILADLLMEERIRGELKQDISYSKDIMNDVKCILTVSIRDHRPCYCGAELREIWRERKDENHDD